MIIEKVVEHKIPEGGILLSKDEAIKHVWNAVWNWKKSRDTWPVIYAGGFLQLTSIVTLGYFNYYFRRRLKLGTMLRKCHYAFGALLPSIFSGTFHYQSVVNDIILQEDCKSCIVAKSMLIQSFFSVVYGVTFPFMFSIYISSMGTIYDGPSLMIRDMPKLFETWKRWVFKTPATHRLLLILVSFNLVFAALIPLVEKQAFDVFYEKWVKDQKERALHLQSLRSEQTKDGTTRPVMNKL